MKKIEIKNKINLKETLAKKNVKYGAYSSAMIAVVIVVAVLINLIISALPSKFTTFDLSENKLSSIGTETVNLLKELDEDVTITVLSDEDSADATIAQLLKAYESQSKHIKVEYADPAVEVGLVNNYSDLYMNSLIVASETKEATIDYYSIYVMDYSSYYTTGSYTTTFDGEGQITSAINYVTSEESPVVYNVVGHGETAVSSTVTNLITKQNISMVDLNLMTENAVPEDGDMVFIYEPNQDYTAYEAELLIDYINDGGKVMALTGYSGSDMPNFSKILSGMGLELIDGIAVEGSNNYYQHPIYVIPDIQSTELTADLAKEKANILIPSAQGIRTKSIEGIVHTEMLSSSDDAFSKILDTDGSIKSFDKDSEDIDGPFGYAYLASDEEKGGELILISASSLIDDSVTQSFTLGNLELFMNCFSYLCDEDSEVSNVSIPQKSMDVNYLSVTTGQINMWIIVSVVLIPASVMIFGIVIWFRRRKK